MFDPALPYDKKVFRNGLLSLVGLVVLLKITRGWGFAVIFPMMFMAMQSRHREKLVFALMAMIAMTVGNSNVLVKSGGFGLMLRLAMVMLSTVMVVQIAGRRNSPLLTPFLMILLYLLYMIVPSAMGWCPAISFLKLALFTSVYFAYYGVLNRMITQSRPGDVLRVRAVVLSVISFFFFGSILLIPFPSIGQMGYEAMREAILNGGHITSLFMGMANHSQMLGPMVAIFGSLVFADFIFSVRRKNNLYLALMACQPILIWKTSSRTAMGSWLSGIMFATFFFMQARGIRSGWKAKVVNTVVMTFMLVAVAVAALPGARKSAVQFVRKFGNAETQGITMEDITASRMSSWQRTLANFHKKPMIGNGFQVSDVMDGMRITSLGQLISAPVEKGTWVVAILEEGGIFGMIIFCLFVLVIFSRLLSMHAYIGATAFFVSLVINLGEFTIFSMTAVGGMLWASVFIGLTLDSQRLAEQRRVGM